MTPGNQPFTEMNPEHLIKNLEEANAKKILIHKAIYDNRLDVNAIIHLQTEACQFISSRPNGMRDFYT